MLYPFAGRVQNITSSAVRDLLSITQDREIISFAGGLPDEGLFPLQALESAYQKVFRHAGSALQYGPTEGDRLLRVQIQERMREKRIEASHENIVITTGSQQALDLLAKLFLSPGDTVLVENPSYLAALQSFTTYEAAIVPVQSDSAGMLPDDLEQKIIAHRPKFIYVVPTFSNPQGKVWSKERREALLQLAIKHNVLIVEDDPYSELRFTDVEVPSLAEMDHAGGHVIYTSTFSKIVAPGIRLGWLTGPAEIIRMIARVKQSTDLHTSSIDQRAMSYFLQEFSMGQHLAVLRQEYSRRSQAMQAHLKSNAEGLFQWVEPKGGMFLWVHIDRPIDTAKLLTEAVQEGVAFVPGAPFFVGEHVTNAFRLNFTNAAPDVIDTGMTRLMRVIENALAAKGYV